MSTPFEARDSSHWSFRRSQWFETVGAECRNVMQNVGLLDMTAFAKARISGPGAEAFQDAWKVDAQRGVAEPLRNPRETGAHQVEARQELGGGLHRVVDHADGPGEHVG